MSNYDKSKVFRFHNSIPNRIITRESGTIEFKESFNWGSKDRYAKTIAAFANNKGGFLVFGVKDNPRELVGLVSTNFENKDDADITGYLNSVFVPAIHFRKYTDSVRRKQVGILEIYPSEKKPVISIKNDGVLKESEIYYRYIARTEKIRYAELQGIVEGEREKIEEKWRNLLRNIGRVSDVEKITMLDETSGQPIRITDDPNAPLVRIEEDPTMGGFTLRYKTVVDEMRNRSNSFKQNKEFNNLMSTLKEDERFCKTRLLYPDNPEGTKAVFYHPTILDELGQHYG